MNMNVNGIGFGAKMPVSRIKIAKNINNKEIGVGEYVQEMLAKHAPIIEEKANYLGRDLVLAQKGDTLLVNSGTVTKAIELNKMEKGEDLINGIVDTLCSANAAEKVGLKNAGI